MERLSPALRALSVAQPSRLRVTAASRRQPEQPQRRLVNSQARTTAPPSPDASWSQGASNSSDARLPDGFHLARRRHHVTPTRYVLVVSVANQTVCLFEEARRRDSGSPARWPSLDPLVMDHPARFRYHRIRRWRCSTSRFGVGQAANSNCTPLGLHRVAEKIGGGWPIGTVFRSRKAVGFTWRGLPDAPIAHRILWLEGLEPGFNRGGQVDTHRRYIYIHGLGNEPTLGRPASRGCVHLAAQDLLPLFDLLPGGTLVWVTAA